MTCFDVNANERIETDDLIKYFIFALEPALWLGGCAIGSRPMMPPRSGPDVLRNKPGALLLTSLANLAATPMQSPPNVKTKCTQYINDYIFVRI